MLGVCLAYVGTSLMLGVFLAALGHRHRVWSRADLAASDVRRRGGGRRRVTIAF